MILTEAISTIGKDFVLQSTDNKAFKSFSNHATLVQMIQLGSIQRGSLLSEFHMKRNIQRLLFNQLPCIQEKPEGGSSSRGFVASCGPLPSLKEWQRYPKT